MNKKKLIELRCKAWGITEDEYYCNQCSDFSLEHMARAYRRGKNKGASDIAIQNGRFYQEQMQDIYDKKNKQIADLEDKLANADYQLEGKDNEIRELKDEVRKLKLLVSSLVYEINQIWDINEMNDDLRMCAEKIDREIQLSKMAEDNRMVISALGFAIVPPKPKLDVKEV